MYEPLILILVVCFFSFFIFILYSSLIKKFRINHPNDKFKIHSMAMISILVIFIFSLTVVGSSLQNLDISSPKNNEDNLSLVIIIDESQSEVENVFPSHNSINHDNTNLPAKNENEKEISNKYNPKAISLLINSPNDLDSIISQIESGKLNPSTSGVDAEISLDKDTILSGLSNKKIYDNLVEEKSSVNFYFLLFNLLLIFLCVGYLLYSLVFSKIIVLKNLNARKCRNHKVLQIVEKLCKEIKIKTPKVFIFDGDPNAFIFGYPALLVISKNLINQLTKEELQLALRHELAHISNRDHIIKPLIQSMRIIFFYNPIVHVLYKKMINERELLADSKFIDTHVEKIKFMEILLKINDYSKDKVFTKNIYGVSSLALVTYKPEKLEITDRFDNLFSHNIKKTFISTLICFFVLFGNISAFVIAQNSFLDHSINVNEQIDNKMVKSNSEDYNNQAITSIYILRLIKENSNLLDITVIEDSF